MEGHIMAEDLISVIVPIYKTERYLRACIDSIVQQTHRNLEIILVNDGSPDNSLAVCKEYAEKDLRIKIVDRPNGGLSAARNSGLKMATGEYVAFVDSDDIIEPFTYEVLLEQLKKDNADISQCGMLSSDNLQYDAVSKKTLEFNTKVLTWREAVIDLLDSGKDFTCSVCNKLYKKELFDDLFFENVRSEDFVMHYRLLRNKNPGFVKVDLPLYHYVKRDHSITTGRLNILNLKFIDMLYDMEKAETDKELLAHWKIQRAISARNILVRQIISNDFPERFQSLRNDMIGARFIIGNKKYRYIERSLKYQISLILVSPSLYKLYIKKKWKVSAKKS